MSRSNKNRRRDVLNIAPRSGHSTLNSSRRQFTPFTNYLSLFEDRRTWHPEGTYRPARSFNRSSHLLTLAPALTRRPRRSRPFKQLPSHTVAFDQPQNVLICVRRERRRRVLFAKKKTGYGRRRRPTFGWYSKISCRR